MNQFDNWNETKKKTHKNTKSRYFHERDVFYCRLGKNIGAEQNGRGEEFIRPIIILRKFGNNLFLGIPTTTQEKNGIFYHRFLLDKNTVDYAILSQIRLIDAKRLCNRIGKVPKKDFEIIKEKTISLIRDGQP